MSRREVYAVGVRLIGVFFAVTAFVGAVAVVSGLLVPRPVSGSAGSLLDLSLRMLAMSLARPLAHVLVAFVLIRKTDWCLKRIGVEAEPTEAAAA